MEKISGIIPASPRVASVDLKEAAAVRAGVPSFGRPEVMSTGSRQLPTYDTTARTSARIQQEMMDWRSKEARDASIASEMSQRFFNKNSRPAEPVADFDAPKIEGATGLVRSKPAGFKSDSLDVATDLVSSRGRIDPGLVAAQDEVSIAQPEGLFPKGSFLDRTA